MVNTIKYEIFRRSGAANLVVSDGIWPKFILVQAFMVVSDTYKNQEDPLNIKL